MQPNLAHYNGWLVGSRTRDSINSTSFTLILFKLFQQFQKYLKFSMVFIALNKFSWFYFDTVHIKQVLQLHTLNITDSGQDSGSGSTLTELVGSQPKTNVLTGNQNCNCSAIPGNQTVGAAGSSSHAASAEEQTGP